MSRTKFLIVTFFVSLFLGGSIVSSAHAAARIEEMKDVPVMNDFDLGPTSFPIELKPGQSITKSLQLTNRLGRDAEFIVEIEDFEGSTDLKQPVALQGSKAGKYSAKDWATTGLKTFTLRHGQRQFFDVTISAPLDANAGDHYLSVLVKTTPKKGADAPKSNVSLTSRVGSLFFVRIPGDIIQKGSLESFTAVSDKIFEKKPFGFQIVYKNTGTVRLTPSGKITVTNMLGRNAGEITIDQFNVLRESVRQHNENWDPGYSFGRNKVVLSLDNGYDNNKETKEMYVWYLPKKELGIALIALIIVILILRWIRKNVHINIGQKEKNKN